MQKDQDRQDHFVATKIAEGENAWVDDPRQNETNEPNAQGDAQEREGAIPSAPASRVPEQFDIGQDDEMVSIGDDDMKDAEIVWEDRPAGSSDRRIAYPSRKQPSIDIETTLADGPGAGNAKSLKTPTRQPPSKRRAATGDMFTHGDEPATKKNIVDEPDDDIDINALVSAHPGVGVLVPGKVGG